MSSQTTNRRRPRDHPRADELAAVLFFFGYGSKQRFLGDGQTRTCPRCHNTTTWSRMREFRQVTVFFIPVARWSRRQYEVCGICGTAVAA